MTAQGVNPASRAPNVAQQQLQHGRRADDLRAKTVLRPAHRVHDGGDLLHVAIFADRSICIGSLQELIFRNARNSLDHLWRVARILLLQQLKDASRMLQCQIISDVRWQHGRGLRGLGSFCSLWTCALIALSGEPGSGALLSLA